MLSAGDQAGVAVSGGADSVVLLHILHRLAPELGVRLKVLHCNHGLRGRESDDDEAFVREQARSLGLECLVDRAQVPEGNLEQEARRARKAFFQRCIAEHSLARVALGHTRSDQAETVLFRVLRGAGLAGLCGMRMIGEGGLIRPLLTVSRSEVRSWATAEGLRWREDSSNGSLEFARNRLRNEAIPALAAHFNPNLEGVLAGMAELAQDEEDYWNQQIEPTYREITKRTELGSILQTDALKAFHVAVQRRLIRRALLDLRGDLRSLDMEHVAAILRICNSSHGHDRVMAPGVDALRSFGTLLLTQPGRLQDSPRHYRVNLNYGEPCELPFRAGWICANRVTQQGLNCANFKEDRELRVEIADLDAGVLDRQDGELASLSVRNWEPGDQIQRAGHGQPEKIKTLFQEGRVLLWERRHWPVVAAGDEIVWVRKFGPAATFAASAGTTQLVRITYRESGG